VKQEDIMLVPPVREKSNYRERIVNALNSHRALLDAALDQFASRPSTLTKAATLLIETLRSGHKVFVAGNGGSAAEAQHFAAELVGRFKRERSPYAALALTTDTAILTAVANDYGYEDVFARQILALGLPGDVLIALSTSGESENLLKAAVAARQCLMSVIAITGNRPGSPLECQADLTLRMPVVDTAITQELHIVMIHILCDLIESELMTGEGGAVR
jgi:D-sedoheptulose 7-phosphate isomerase